MSKEEVIERFNVWQRQMLTFSKNAGYVPCPDDWFDEMNIDDLIQMLYEYGFEEEADFIYNFMEAAETYYELDGKLYGFYYDDPPIGEIEDD